MNFPKFWAQGTYKNFFAWRWSDSSQAEAEALAAAAARQLAEQFAADKLPPPGAHYGYPDRPMREPVLREFRDLSGGLTAAVTRNAYGCLVLNTARAMFVDVDLPEPKRVGGGFFSRLFGKKPEPAPAGNPAEAPVLAQAEVWSRQNPGWSWRVYRTKAGLRLLATHDLFDPASAETQAVFDALGADPLYRRLCQVQNCFRARLTPKPWRCGHNNPPSRWPWPDAKAEKRFNAWEAGYREVCEGYATCSLVAVIGNGLVHPEVRAVLDLHDTTTLADSKLKLA